MSAIYPFPIHSNLNNPGVSFDHTTKQIEWKEVPSVSKNLPGSGIGICFSLVFKIEISWYDKKVLEGLFFPTVGICGLWKTFRR